jgi:hypothetical protein
LASKDLTRTRAHPAGSENPVKRKSVKIMTGKPSIF